MQQSQSQRHTLKVSLGLYFHVSSKLVLLKKSLNFFFFPSQKHFKAAVLLRVPGLQSCYFKTNDGSVHFSSGPHLQANIWNNRRQGTNTGGGNCKSGVCDAAEAADFQNSITFCIKKTAVEILAAVRRRRDPECRWWRQTDRRMDGWKYTKLHVWLHDLPVHWSTRFSHLYLEVCLLHF